MSSCLKSLLLGLLLSFPAWGDELILKDGKNITWKSITDDGASITAPKEKQ